MPDADRIAALQRLAYGAGTGDIERARAAAELEDLRRGRSGTSGGSGTAGTTGTTATGTTGTATSAARAGSGAAVAVAERGAAREAATGGLDELLTGLDDETRPEAASARAATVLRVAGLASAMALAIGFAAGWVAATNLAEPAPGPDDRDSSITFDLDETETETEPAPGADGGDVPVGRTQVFRLFDRAPTDADLDIDRELFSHLEIVPDSPRLLVAWDESSAVHVLLTAEGDLCLAMRFDTTSAGGTCTNDGMFPGAGLVLGMDGRGVRLGADGSLAILPGYR
ncbi:hypothetical protein [Agromyces marinus]|uniref:DUF1707 domain-containing protein n=1 Tax=Agromyces marinus TaxID=1389020 RepID=A0ABN6YB13_9MICO|nr:hypothetical protein [Agromyces marinus]UIP57351.1 hypothetical protein DSM26151_02060 [Agromyces marinus]BDZ54544.1 hypothetical protein GCM10025870_16170 [Agromyces marinus]